jgi:hypothetical protein
MHPEQMRYIVEARDRDRWHQARAHRAVVTPSMPTSRTRRPIRWYVGTQLMRLGQALRNGNGAARRPGVQSW